MRKQGIERRLLPLFTGRIDAEQALSRVITASPGQANESDLQLLARYASNWEDLAAVAAEAPADGWDAASNELKAFVATIDAALRRGA
jgi:hypothetical protein